LQFVRSGSSSGESPWEAPVPVDAGPVDWDVSLAVIDGFPAITYGGAVADAGKVLYARATDADGTAWSR
jgi:hypothetical protein